jgi:hypothetical protein
MTVLVVVNGDECLVGQGFVFCDMGFRFLFFVYSWKASLIVFSEQPSITRQSSSIRTKYLCAPHDERRVPDEVRSIGQYAASYS